MQARDHLRQCGQVRVSFGRIQTFWRLSESKKHKAMNILSLMCFLSSGPNRTHYFAKEVSLTRVSFPNLARIKRVIFQTYAKTTE